MALNEYKLPSNLADVVFAALSGLPEEMYKNGRTAAFWHLMGVLDEHLKDEHDFPE